MFTILAAMCLQEPLVAYTETIPKAAVKFDMVPLPAGKVTVGGKSVDVKPIYMAKTETTWEMFDAYYLSGPPSPPYDQTEYTPDAIARPSKTYILPDLGWGHAGHPAICISSTSATMFCRWLSSVTGKKYRLPTEAEWEFACRCGAADWKLDKAAMDKEAWHSSNSEAMTHAVGKKQPSKFGLFDIFGNAGEWAVDDKGKFVLCGGTYLDAPASQSPEMRRKWSPKWQETDPQVPKSRWWLSDGSFVGFRVVCEP